MSEGKVKWGGGICVNFQYLNYVYLCENDGGERGRGVLIGKNFMFIHTINMYKRKIQTIYVM